MSIKKILINLKYLIASYRLLFLSLASLGILVDIFFLKKTSETVTISIAIFWGLFIWISQWEGRFSAFIGIILLIMTGVLDVLTLEKIAEKTAVIAFIFLTIGIIQQFLEDRLEIKNLKKFSISRLNFLEKQKEEKRCSEKRKK